MSVETIIQSRRNLIKCLSWATSGNTHTEQMSSLYPWKQTSDLRIW